MGFLDHDIWRVAIFVGLTLGVVWVTRFSLLWMFCLVSALFGFASPWISPHGFFLQIRINQSAAVAFAELLIIPLAICRIPSKYFKHWKKFFVGVGLFEVFAIFFHGWGLMNAQSFDSAFIASVVPLAGIWTAPILIMGVFYARGLTAFLILGVYYLWWCMRRPRTWVLLPFLGVASFYSQAWHLGESSGTRVQIFKTFMGWWWAHDFKWFGTGLGSFEWIGLSMGPILGGSDYFLMMHMDWCQILFEMGFVGAALVLGFYGKLLWRAKGRMLPMVVGLGAFALTYHPLRFFPTQLLIMCVIREVLNEVQKDKG